MSDILTSESGIRMLGYVSPIYFQSRIMLAIFQVNGLQVDDLQSWTAGIRDQLFPQTATWGLKYWESLLGLLVNESISIETRRQKVLSRLVTRTPITPEKMKFIVEQTTSVPAEIEENIADYTFRVVIYPDGQTSIILKDVIEAVNAAKPAHLSYEIGLKYASTISLKGEMLVNVPSELVFCGEIICGAYPEENAATEYAAEIRLAALYSTAEQAYKLCGAFMSGDDTEFSNDAASYSSNINITASYSTTLKNYLICGEIICGEAII
ncbi:MAG: YmfQ family protein [Firmicutes bacterium]|nr:YmfQ family protein [Bacillota bacterium]